MRTVTAMDLRKRLGEILGAASAGERILIERDHKPLAYLVSVEEGERRDPDVEATVSRDSLRWIDWSASERRCGRDSRRPTTASRKWNGGTRRSSGG